MSRNYGNHGHPEEAFAGGKRLARVLGGSLADVPPGCSQVRLLSADCDVGSCRSLTPVSAPSGSRKDFAATFLVADLPAVFRFRCSARDGSNRSPCPKLRWQCAAVPAAALPPWRVRAAAQIETRGRKNSTHAANPDR